MRVLIFLAALHMQMPHSHADISAEELTAAIVRTSQMIRKTVEYGLSDSIKELGYSESQASELIDLASTRMASCKLEALAFLGEDVREDAIAAMAAGLEDQEVSDSINHNLRKHQNFMGVLREYSDAIERCKFVVGQELGVEYK